MKISLFIGVLLQVSLSVCAQKTVLPETSSDCDNAIVVKDTVYGPTTSPRGYGNVMEFEGNDPKSLYYFEQEHNTVWYTFTSPYNTTLSIDIIPTDPREDLDFLLFKAEAGNFCERIQKRELKPVRTNISRVKPEIEGKTGLSGSATQPFIHSGPGDAYSKALTVKRGDKFYLVIDHYEAMGAGHILHLHYKDTKIPDKETADVKQEAPIEKAPEIILKLSVYDAGTKEPLAANIEIIGLRGKESLHENNIQQYITRLDQYKSYSINISRPGYMYSSQRVVTSIKADTIPLRVELHPIKYGEKIRIQDIYFKGNAADILPNSADALETLVQFLQENSNVRVEIQGHVNAPGKKNNKKAKALSRERAASVYHYLVLNDIDPERMRYKGYGNTEMLYPEPIDETQAQMNRRVEIKVISKD